MTTFIINLDYEWKLFGNNIQPGRLRKIQREFEFIFFFIEEKKCQLFSEFIYPDEYLNSISTNLINLNPVTNVKNNPINWWGKLENLDSEKNINSKITSFEISKRLGILPEGVVIIDSLEKFKIRIESMPAVDEFIIKDPNSMGGQGNIIFKKSEIENNIHKISAMIKNRPAILSPFFERILDFGTVINLDNHQFSVNLNFNNKFGIFRGGTISKGELLPKDFLPKLIKIAEEYKILGATGEIQVDSFKYIFDGRIQFYHLLEVNYRKTMGHFLRSIDKIFNSKIGKSALLIVYRNDLLVDLFHQNQNKFILENSIGILSPNYVIEEVSRQKLYLDNIFLVIPFENFRNNKMLALLNIVKPNSSTFILLTKLINSFSN